MNDGPAAPKELGANTSLMQRAWWAWLVTPVAEESRLRKFLWVVPGESPLRTFLKTLAVMAVVSPVIPLVHYLGRPNLERPAVFVAIVLAAAITISGKMRTQWWFWATMIAVAAAHLLFILRVHWTDRWVPAGVLIGFAAVDLVIIYYLVCFVAKLMGKEALAKESFAGGKQTDTDPSER